MEDQEYKSVIESILFMSGEPVNVDGLKKILKLDKVNTARLVKELSDEYSLRNTGLMILEIAGGYQMVTNPACSPWVKKMLATAVPKKLTQSSLETLAIMAYKQPIIKAEIEAIRGVNSDGVVKTLLERRMIKILGRKEVPGRPLMYGTTQEFLQYFGLKDLSEMPTLKEFEEMEVPELFPESSENDDIRDELEEAMPVEKRDNQVEQVRDMAGIEDENAGEALVTGNKDAVDADQVIEEDSEKQDSEQSG